MGNHLNQGSNTIATSLRVPDKLLNEIKDLANEIGDSQNGMMMQLMYLGLKIYKSDFAVNLDVSRDSLPKNPQ